MTEKAIKNISLLTDWYQYLLLKKTSLEIKTITGTLPLTVTAKGGNAVDWTISGNSGGVGERTVNLLKDEWRQGNAQDLTTTVRCCATSVIPTVLGDTFSFGLYDATKRYAIYGINAAGLAEFNRSQTVSAVNRIYNPGFTTDNKTVTTEDANIVAYMMMLALSEGTVPATIVPNDCKRCIAVVRGTDLPQSYIPYGYKVPITVSQGEENYKNYEIFIGDAPLTEGETVSKTSTGIDIELFEGENTINTTLYNKPNMEIKYK